MSGESLMDWEKYFMKVVTYSDWNRVWKSGMAWVFWPDFPFNWEEHCKKLEEYLGGKTGG